MSRIKHPVRAIREPFGTAGLVVAVVALVLALTGAAFAAAGLTGKQKKEVEKIAKKFQGSGPQGAPGAPGSNGTNGKDGAAGAKGENGTDGTNGTPAEAISFVGTKTIGSVTCTEGGIEVKSAKPTVLVCNGEEGAAGTNGTNGTNGTSAKATSFPGNEHGCIEGGIEVESAEPTTYVCNGSPWTAGGTLPSGSTETGAWAVTEYKSGGGGNPVKTAISFPIPLGASPAAGHVISEPVGYTGTNENCPGTISEPKAKKGFLCVYSAELAGSLGAAPEVVAPDELVETFEEAVGIEEASAGTAGAKLVIMAIAEEVFGSGTWAVTAP